MPTEDGEEEVMCVAMVLMMFQCVWDDDTLALAFVWWFTEEGGGADASSCLVYERSWQMRPSGTNNRMARMPWTEVVPLDRVLYRVHMVPQKHPDTWQQSTSKFRLNKWLHHW